MVAFLAMALERLFGYPAIIQNRFGHPVEAMGALIGWCDQHWNKDGDKPTRRRQAGVAMLLFVCATTALITLTLTALLYQLPFGWVLEAVLASTFLAHRQLGAAVMAVATGLDNSLAAGREAVSHIVGRDTTELDEAEVSRAAIETLAENASDGVIAPLFWLVIFGLPGIAIYKVINTADSMVGHLNEQYRDFGWASAKIDDVVNWIPARLTALLFALTAALMPGASFMRAWQTFWRDGPKHNSPNAGWPEAAMAGALSFGLGGPRNYAGKLVDLPTMGTGNRDLGPKDIRLAKTLFSAAGNFALVIVGLTAILALITA